MFERVSQLRRRGEGCRWWSRWGRPLLYIFLPRPCPTRKKSTFINLVRDICAHNFRDPAIKLRPERERSGVRSTISRLLYLLFDFVYIIFKLEAETDNSERHIHFSTVHCATSNSNSLRNKENKKIRRELCVDWKREKNDRCPAPHSVKGKLIKLWWPRLEIYRRHILQTQLSW